MRTLPEWLKEQRELCEKATKAPWAAYKWGNVVQVDIGDEPLGRRPCIANWCGFDSNDLSLPENKGNVEFIAAARLSHPQALRIIEEIYAFADEALDPTDRDRIAAIAERIINESAAAGGVEIE